MHANVEMKRVTFSSAFLLRTCVMFSWLAEGDQSGKLRTNTSCSSSDASMCVTDVITAIEETTSIQTGQVSQVSAVTATTTSPVPTTSKLLCPSGTYYYNSKCYHVERISMSWITARRQCIERGMTLAKIEDLGENSFITDLVRRILGRREIWIGLRCYENSCKWTDGTTSPFNRWSIDAPVGRDKCVKMRVDGSWRKVNCRYSKYSICKGDEIQISTPQPITTDNRQSTSGSLTVTNVTLTTSTDEGSSLSAWIILGILIGIIGLIILVVAVYLLIRLRRERSRTYNATENGFTNVHYDKAVENVSLSDENRSGGGPCKF